MEERIMKAIFAIEKELDQATQIETESSLYTGFTGHSLFYIMLYKLTKKEEYLKKFEGIIDKIYEGLNEDDYSYTFADGLSGIAFLLNFYQKNGIIDHEDVADALSFFDQVILQNLTTVLDSEEQMAVLNKDGDLMDLLHGVLGMAYYLNDRVPYNAELKVQITPLFEKLSTCFKRDIDEFKRDNEGVFNCGLAHGVISQIIVTSKFLKENGPNVYVEQVMKDSIDQLLVFESKQDSDPGKFPFIVKKGEEVSYLTPLGWCYGDQTISVGLEMAASILNEKSLKEKALEIALHAANRDTIGKACNFKEVDAGFCHGTSSIAYINKRWFQLSGNQKFKETYLLFLDETLKKGNHDSVLSGYKKNMGKDNTIEAQGLLDGVCGIGVVLIDELLKEELGWDELFLLR